VELRDFIVTPVVIFLVYTAAYIARPYLADKTTARYYFPALTVKIIGAISIGLIYQFYYNGGDTFNFHTRGSRIIWEALVNQPLDGLNLFFASKDPELYAYVSRIPFYYDDSSFFVVRLAVVFDLFTFSTYSATAVLFALIGFLGSWFLFLTFYDIAPAPHRWFAVASFFIPSVFFWGSGIMKDTLTLAATGLVTYSAYQIFIRFRWKVIFLVVLLLSLYILYAVKIYILLTLVPGLIVWIFLSRLVRIRSQMTRIVLLPFVVVTVAFCCFFAVTKAAEDNPKYSLEALAKTAQITAYDIRYWTGRNAGSGYSLGELDGTWRSMISLAPQAVVVALFRPFLWEVSNPLMLLSALEAFAFLLLICYITLHPAFKIRRALRDPNVLFCLIFSLAFAFAVGVATYNFGTLVRYKIPMMPFFVVGLALIIHYSNTESKARI
jgi:hypothetical protein